VPGRSATDALPRQSWTNLRKPWSIATNRSASGRAIATRWRRGVCLPEAWPSDESIADYDAEVKINPGNPYSLFGAGPRGAEGRAIAGRCRQAAATAIKAGIAEAMAKLGVRL
jgi:hypothetical protein